MVFHWSVSDSKSPQVSRTRLSILAVLSNAVVWIVSSKSSRPFNNPLVVVPNALITIGTIVTFMFHSFFNSLARSRYLSFFSLSFRFIFCSAGTAKLTILQIIIIYSSRVFTSVLADGFSLEFEWQQVFSSLHWFMTLQNHHAYISWSVETVFGNIIFMTLHHKRYMSIWISSSSFSYMGDGCLYIYIYMYIYIYHKNR